MPLVNYPNEFATPEEKANPEYGRAFLSALWSSFGGWKAYSERRARMLEMRRWRSGAQGIEDMKDIMGADDTSWYNLDWEPSRVIANKSDTVVSYLDAMPFKIVCEGADILSITEKDKERMKLYAKAMVKPMRVELEQAMGIKLSPENEHDPDDMEDVDLYMQGEHKLSVEVGMEAALKYFFKLNDFREVKRLLIEDLWTLYGAALYVSYNGEKLSFEYVNFPDIIIPMTKTSSFKNAKYGAHITWKKLGDVRKEAGDTITFDEYKRIANIAYNYSVTGQWNTYIGNGQYYGSTVYNSEWDNLDVPVIVGEFRSANIVKYNVSKKKNGRMSVSEGEGAIQKDWEDVYCGKYIPDANVIYNYGKKKNMPRNKTNGQYDLSGVLGYCIFQPVNYDNFNVSPVGRMIPFGKKVQLIELRMQHLIAKSSPGGYALNLDAMAEASKLLKGIKDPMKIYSIFTQTGAFYYRGMKADGSYQEPPIKFLQGIDLVQLQGLTQTYLFYMGEMERAVGGSAVGMGAVPEERTAVGVQQLAQQAADNALGYIKFALEDIVIRASTQMARYIQMMHRQNKFDINSLAYGKENIQAIKDMGNFELRDYNIFINYRMTLEEEAVFNEFLKEALAKGTLMPEQAMWLKEMSKDSVKMAMLYARRERKKQEKQAAAMQQQNIVSQQQTAQMTAQLDMQNKQAELQLKLQSDMQLKQMDMDLEEKRHNWKMQEIALQQGMKNENTLQVAEIKSGDKDI